MKEYKTTEQKKTFYKTRAWSDVRTQALSVTIMNARNVGSRARDDESTIDWTNTSSSMSTMSRTSRSIPTSRSTWRT